MSHVAGVELCVKETELDAFEAAANECGFELHRGVKTYDWYGRFLNDWSDRSRAAVFQGYDPSQYGKCDHELRLKGSTKGDGNYSIGLVRRKDGTGYDLLYDVFGVGSKLTQAGGDQMSKLKGSYAAAVSERHLRMQGYRTARRYNEAGELQVVGVKN